MTDNHHEKPNIIKYHLLHFFALPLASRDTPVAVEDPGALLALFAAVLGASASPALGELPCVFFPPPTLVVGTLPDATTGVVFSAQVAHNHAGPVLHVRCVVTDGELLDQREDVEVVG